MPLAKDELEHWFSKTGGKPFWIIERSPIGPTDVYFTEPVDAEGKTLPGVKKVER